MSSSSASEVLKSFVVFPTRELRARRCDLSCMIRDVRAGTPSLNGLFQIAGLVKQCWWPSSCTCFLHNIASAIYSSMRPETNSWAKTLKSLRVSWSAAKRRPKVVAGVATRGSAMCTASVVGDIRRGVSRYHPTRGPLSMVLVLTAHSEDIENDVQDAMVRSVKIVHYYLSGNGTTNCSALIFSSSLKKEGHGGVTFV